MQPRSIRSAIVASIAGLAFSGCQSVPGGGPVADAEVRGALQNWSAAFNACDVDAAAALYAPEALLWGTVSPELISTPEALRQYFTRACASGVPPKVLVTQELVRVNGESAVSSGAYTFTLGSQGQPRTVAARFSFAYRKAGAGWLIVSHHSSSLPGVASAAAR